MEENLQQAMSILVKNRWSLQPYEDKWYAAEMTGKDDDVSWPVIPWTGSPVVFDSPVIALLEAEKYVWGKFLKRGEVDEKNQG